MNVVLVMIAAAGGLTDQPGPRQVRFDVRVCQGDPLGSRAEGTVKYIAEPSVVSSSGRSAVFRTGGAVGVLDPDGRPGQEWVGAAVELLPICQPGGTIWVGVNATHRWENAVQGQPGRPTFTEQGCRQARFVTPGETFRFRISADSPKFQTWAEVTVRQEPAEK
jgi:hypothetical protein